MEWEALAFLIQTKAIVLSPNQKNLHLQAIVLTPNQKDLEVNAVEMAFNSPG
jgi:hypothetical protein